MRNPIIIAALLAATAAVPAIAQEDRRDQRQHRMDAADQPQPEAGGPRQNWQRSDQGERAARMERPAPPAQAFPQPQAAPQQQAMPQRDLRERPMMNGGERGGNFGWRGNRGEVQGAAPVAAPPVYQNEQRREPGRSWQGNANQNGNRDDRQDNPRDARRWEGRDNRQDSRGQTFDRGNRDNQYRTPGVTFGNGGRSYDWRNRTSENRGGPRDWRDHDRDDRGNFGNRGQSWNRDWRHDRRYDWQNYRSSNRDYYRLPQYRAPYGYGYGYQRFGIGIYLDDLLFSRSYWIDDPYSYRLPEAYPPYHWVRYYNDALLVDERSGYVVDVIYDIFY